MNPQTIITIDGPSGVGKSSVAKALASALHKPFLSTGSMFRVVALELGENALPLSGTDLAKRCEKFTFRLTGTGESSLLTFNGKPIPETIHSERAAKLAAQLALIPAAREYMKKSQRNLSESASIVAEGRDLGTEIFPDAQYKFFLNSNARVRAQRRFEQLKKRGAEPTFDDILKSLEYRDSLDRGRSVAPLIPAPDAFIIDSSSLTLDEVIQIMLNKILDRN